MYVQEYIENGYNIETAIQGKTMDTVIGFDFNQKFLISDS